MNLKIALVMSCTNAKFKLGQPWQDHETLIVQKHFDGCSTWFLKALLNNVAS